MAKESSDIPDGVRIISYATAIRWVGWGFVEALIPVFMYSFSKNYLTTALIYSSYWLFFLLALPFVGVFADKISCRWLIIGALILYPFVGLGYFLAGALGIVAFIVIARMINGVAWAMDSVGRDTYFRRYADHRYISGVFGYFSSIANFWWIIALLSSLVLLKFVDLHWLFLGITFTAIIASGLVFSKLKPDRQKNSFSKILMSGNILSNIWKEIKDSTKAVRILSVFFFLEC